MKTTSGEETCGWISTAMGKGWNSIKRRCVSSPITRKPSRKQSSAEILLGDLSDAEDDAAKAIAAGASVSIPVDHVGFICSLGTLTIGRGRVTFQQSRS